MVDAKKLMESIKKRRAGFTPISASAPPRSFGVPTNLNPAPTTKKSFTPVKPSSIPTFGQTKTSSGLGINTGAPGNLQHTGTRFGITDIYKAPSGTSIRSPFTGASIGMSAYGKPLTGPLTAAQSAKVLEINPRITQQVRDAFTKRFGFADQSSVAGIVNKIVNEGMPFEHAQSLINQGYNIADKDRRDAGDLVAMEFDPRERALERLIEAIGRERDRSVGIQKDYGELGDQRLQDIWNQTTNKLNQQTKQTKQSYADANKDIAGYYQDAMQQGQQTGHEVTDKLLQSAKALGLDAATKDPLNKLAEQMQQFSGDTAQAQADSQANMRTLGASMESLSAMASQAASHEGAQSRTNLMNNVASAIGQLEFEAFQNIAGAEGELKDLAAQRATALRIAYDEVVNARTERERQARLDALAEELQRGALDLQKQQLGLQREQLGLQRDQFDFTKDITNRQFDLARSESDFNRAMATQDQAMKKQMFELQRMELEAKLNQTQDPLERQMIAAQINKIKAETQKLGAETSAIRNPNNPANQPQYRGQQGVHDWAIREGLGMGWGANAIQMIHQADAIAANQRSDARGVARNLVENMLNARQITPQQAQQYNTAIDIYYGRHASYAP